jgi:hypothetical protein
MSTPHQRHLVSDLDAKADPETTASLETAELSLNPDFMTLIERSRESCRTGRTKTSEEVRRMFPDDNGA